MHRRIWQVFLGGFVTAATLWGCDWGVDPTNEYDPQSTRPATVLIEAALVPPGDPDGRLFDQGPEATLEPAGTPAKPHAASVGTDGRIRFSSVRPGAYVLRYAHPALEPFALPVTVAAPRDERGRRVDLGVLLLRPLPAESERLTPVSGVARRGGDLPDDAHGDIEVWSAETGERAVTDEEGHYRIQLPLTGTYTLRARADGYQQASVRDVVPGSGAAGEMVLDPLNTSLRASVVLPAGAQGPARVTYHVGSPTCQAEPRYQTVIPFNGVGHYEHSALPPEDQGGLLIEHASVQRLCVPVALTPGRRVELTGLRPTPKDAVRVTGVVHLERTDGPVEGVLVAIGGLLTQTDASGHFALAVPPAAEARPVRLSGAGFQPNTGHSLPPVGDAPEYPFPDPLTVAHAPTRVDFRVRFDRFGQGAGAAVTAVLDRLDPQGGALPPRETLQPVDAEDLRYSPMNLVPGEPHRLTVTRPGYVPEVLRFVPQPGIPLELGDVRLQHASGVTPAYLTPQILNPQGEPVAGAAFQVNLAEPARTLLVASGFAGPDGRLQAQVAPDEAYTLTVSAPGHQPFVGRVQAPPAGEAGVMLGDERPQREATLTLPIEPLNGEIAVSVDFGFDWLPPGDIALVSVRPAGGEPDRRAVSAAQGRERFVGLARGLYTVRVERAGFLPVEQDVVLDLDHRDQAVQADLVLVDLATARPGFSPGDRLPGADLQARRATLPIQLVGANLAGLRLEGDFSGLDLRRTDLSGATFVDADFSRASLDGSNLSLVRAEGAHFDRAVFSGANLSSGIFTGASFVGARMTDVDATRARLADAHFVDPAADGLAEPCGDRDPADPSRANLRGIRLTDSDLTRARMAGVDLRQADLSFAQLDDTGLSRACLAEADLTLTALRGTELDRADLSRASLVNAVLSGTDLRGANLHGAVLFGVSMSSVNLGCFQALGTWPGESFCACPGQARGLDACPAEARDAVPWDQCRTNLTAANLGGAVVAGSNFTGADLYQARLVGVDLSAVCEADQGDDAPLACDLRSRFTQADFTLAQLPGMLVGAVDLRGTCFRGADLTSAEFSRQTRFTAADFRGAILEGARLDEADLRSARFDGAQMARAQLRSAQVQGVAFDGADLRSAELEEANLIGTSFQAALLHRVDLAPSIATGADFGHADLQGARLRFAAPLHHARFGEARLTGTELSGVVRRVDLRGADLSRSVSLDALEFEGTSMSGVTLDEVDWTIERMTDVDLSGATSRGGRILGPDGVYPSGQTFESAGTSRVPHCRRGDRRLPTGEVAVIRTRLTGVVFEDVALSGLNFEGVGFEDAELTRVNLRGSYFNGFRLDGLRGHDVEFYTSRFELGGANGARFTGGSFQNVDFRLTDLEGFRAEATSFGGAFFHLVRLQGTPENAAGFSGGEVNTCVSGSTLTHAVIDGDPFRGATFSYTRAAQLQLTGAGPALLSSHNSTFEFVGAPPQAGAWMGGEAPDNTARVFNGVDQPAALYAMTAGEPGLHDGLCAIAEALCGDDHQGNPCPLIGYACEHYDLNNTACDFEWCGVASTLMCDAEGNPQAIRANILLENLPIVGDIEREVELPLAGVLNPCDFLLDRACQNSFGSCSLHEGGLITGGLDGGRPLPDRLHTLNLAGATIRGPGELRLEQVNLDNAAISGVTVGSERPAFSRVAARDAVLTGVQFLDPDALQILDADFTGATFADVQGQGWYLENARLDRDGSQLMDHFPIASRIWMPDVDLSAGGSLSNEVSDSDLRGLRTPPFLGGRTLRRTMLDGADFHGTQVPDGRLIIEGGSVRGADFRGVHMPRLALTGSVVDGATFAGTEATHTELAGVDFTGATMLWGDLSRANLVQARFTDFWLGNKDFTGSTFGAADLAGRDLSDAVLDGADLSGADLSGATLFRISGVQALLNGANLSGAWISGNLAGAQLASREGAPADLTAAHLVQVDLQGADLAQAILRGADLWGADLRGANLTDVVIDDATVLVGAQVCADAPAAFFDRGAVLAEEGC